MEDQVKQLVDRAWTKFQTLPSNERLLIAISGIPGSGKTTLARTISSHLNTIHSKAHPSAPPIAAIIPMDGYHLTRSQLSQLPNASEAIFRRGAAFTFDSSSYLSLIRELRKPLPTLTPISSTSPNDPEISGEGEDEEGVIYAPSFDHAIKDPVENDIKIPPTSRILLIEGLYLSLSSPSSASSNPDYVPPDPPHSLEWSQAGDLMNEHWFIETDFDTAAKRLVKRHLESGICDSREVAEQRAWESDLRNGREIVEGRRVFRDGVDVILKSWEDEGWR